MERPEEAPLIDRDLGHKQARTHTEAEVICEIHMCTCYMFHYTQVGGESVEVTQLESITAYVTVIASAVDSTKPQTQHQFTQRG